MLNTKHTDINTTIIIHQKNKKKPRYEKCLLFYQFEEKKQQPCIQLTVGDQNFQQKHLNHVCILCNCSDSDSHMQTNKTEHYFTLVSFPYDLTI